VKGWKNRKSAYSHIQRAHERFFLYGQRLESMQNQLNTEREEKQALSVRVVDLETKFRELSEQMAKVSK
jgi:hypothetical protein